MSDHVIPDSASQRPDPARATTPEELITELNRLRGWVGRPSFRTLQVLAEKRSRAGETSVEPLPTSTTHEILSGKRLPRLPRLRFVESFVTACLLSHDCPADEIAAEVERWRQSWRALAEADEPEPGRDGAATGVVTPAPAATRTASTAAPASGTEPTARSAAPAATGAPTGHTPIPGPHTRGPTPPLTRVRPLLPPLLLALTIAVIVASLVRGETPDGGAASSADSSQALPDPAGQECSGEEPAPPPEGEELVVNGDFTEGMLPWGAYSRFLTTYVEDDVLRGEVERGSANRWDVHVEQRDIALVEGRAYTLSFEITATSPVTVRAAAQMQRDPFDAVIGEEVMAGPTPCLFSFSGVSPLTEERSVVTFQLGGNPDDYEFTLDNVSLIEHTD